MTRRWLPIGVGAGITLGLVACARVPVDGAGWRVAFVALHLGAFLALIRTLRTVTLDARTVLIGAVVFRLCALPLLPTLSDDGYRYLWDGLVVVEMGESPYAFRPSDPALSAWHGLEVYEQMNSSAYYSVYPPVSQAAFALGASVHGLGWRAAWWALKGLMVAAEMTAVLALMRVVPPSRVALYAWSPLAVIEIAGQGHTEALVLVGLSALLVTSHRTIPLRSLGVAFAGAVKLYPLALLPHAWRRDGVRGVLASLAMLGLLSIPLWRPSALAHVSESLGLFFGTFDEYAAPYRLLKALLYPIAGDGAGRASSALLAGVFAAGAAVLVLTDDGSPGGLRRAVAAVAVGFVVTVSTLHPWYWLPVLYVVPLLQTKNPWLWVVGWAPATYLNYVWPSVDLAIIGIGWGGAGVLWWITRREAQATAPRRPTRDRPSSRPRRARAHRETGDTM